MFLPEYEEMKESGGLEYVKKKKKKINKDDNLKLPETMRLLITLTSS